MAALSIAAIRLASRDPERLARFLRDALGFEDMEDRGLRLGAETVEIVRAAGAPYPPDIVSNDTRFQHFAIVVSDIDAAYARLTAIRGWRPISTAGPERLPDASGGVAAFKFRSPDGHPLEFLQFPPDRAPEPWRSRAGLHLGIDHSAIGVADTERSIRFYERLGFRLASRQVNRGPEQARLDAVADPLVEVTAMKPPGRATPHLELLSYRRPPAVTSPPAAADAVAATSLVLADLEDARQDPDGHRLVRAAAIEKP